MVPWKYSITMALILEHVDHHPEPQTKMICLWLLSQLYPRPG